MKLTRTATIPVPMQTVNHLYKGQIHQDLPKLQRIVSTYEGLKPMIISLHFDRRLSGMVEATSNGIPGLSYADTVRSTKSSSASMPTSVIWLCLSQGCSIYVNGMDVEAKFFISDSTSTSFAIIQEIRPDKVWIFRSGSFRLIGVFPSSNGSLYRPKFYREPISRSTFWQTITHLYYGPIFLTVTFNLIEISRRSVV